MIGRLIAAALVLGLIAGCGAPGSPPNDAVPSPLREVTGTPSGPEVAGVVARDLAVPWGVDFLPGGEALVAERDTARIVRVTPTLSLIHISEPTRPY